MKKNQELQTLQAEPRNERRYFAPEVRKAIVKEIDDGLSKADAARKYAVSQATIYKWIVLYSSKYEKQLVVVVEHTSATNQVLQKDAELQRVYALLGRIQAENMFLNAVIDTANEELGVDLKKNSSSKPPAGLNQRPHEK